MLENSSLPAKVVAGLGIWTWIAAVALVGQAGASGARVTSVQLKVAVDRSSPCKLALSASIGASEKATIWYRFDGPPGVTFDFGPEGTKTLEFDTSFGAGKGANMRQDIHGEFRVEAAIVGPDGKHGPVVSGAAPANYTCGGGSSVASPIAAGASSQTAQTPAQSAQGGAAGSPGFQVTAVKIPDHIEAFNGNCPTNDMVFRWEVTANGSGSAVVRFTQETRPIREETVSFAASGSKIVTYQASHMGAPGGHYQGWIGLEVLSPNKLAAVREAYTMQCAPRAK